MKRLALALGVASLLGVGMVHAQTTPTYRIQWDMPESQSIAQGYTYTWSLDGTEKGQLAQTCVPFTDPNNAATHTRCTAPLTSAITGAGSHTVILTAWNGFGSTASDPLTGSAPGKAATVTVTVTITIGG